MENAARPARLDIQEVSPAVYAHMIGFRSLLAQSGLDADLRELIKVRVSQINGCAYCLELHVREARKLGIPDDKLHMLNAWHDAPCFSDAERAALELTESVTRIARTRCTRRFVRTCPRTLHWRAVYWTAHDH